MTPDPMRPNSTTPALPLDARRRRILFRATHRGTKEADFLVGGFVARHLAAMDDAELYAVEQVLALPDTDLADWLTGRRAIPEECETEMLRAMLAAMR